MLESNAAGLAGATVVLLPGRPTPQDVFRLWTSEGVTVFFGAPTGYAGMLAAPLCVVLVLALLYGRFSDVPQVTGALRGMGAVAAGLIAATGLKLLVALKKHPLGLPLGMAFAIATFIAVALLRMPLAWALLALGLPACALTWKRLGDSA